MGESKWQHLFPEKSEHGYRNRMVIVIDGTSGVIQMIALQRLM